MKFIKFLFVSLAVCMSLSVGFISCGDKNDDDTETVANTGNKDGEAVAAAVQTIKKNGSDVANVESIAACATIASTIKNYKDSNDKEYKIAFAEAAVGSFVSGVSPKGEAAVQLLDSCLGGFQSEDAATMIPAILALLGKSGN